MQDLENTDPGDDLARRFRETLAPAPVQIDEQALWYAAGYAAGRGRRRTLSAYAAAMTAAATSMGVSLWRTDSGVHAQPRAASSIHQPAPPELVWRSHGIRVRADGTIEDPPRAPLVDAPPTVFERPEPATVRNLLQELLSGEQFEPQPPRGPEVRAVSVHDRGVA